MSMSRKHYEMIASDIKTSVVTAAFTTTENYSTAVRVLTELAESLAVTFEGDNPNFDPNRFLIACGVQA